MHTCKARIQVFRILARPLAIVVITGSVLLQPLLAADSWFRVKKLKEGMRVYVSLSGARYEEGSFLRADDSVMNIRVANRGAISLDRDLVLQVAVHHSGRHWYSIPLSIVAAVAGGAGGYGIAERTTCSDTQSNCSKAKGVIISGLAVGAAAVTYTLTRNKDGRRVIYTKEHQ